MSGDCLSGAGAAFEAARCFADYQVALATLPGPALDETIERFHDLPRRMADLDTVAAADPVGRRSAVEDDIDRARRLSHAVCDELASRAGATPVRIVHNDAKLSNVRFDADGATATCVVDLDTTMPGRARHDFGELVRTTISRSPEDGPDEARVEIDLDLLAALASGTFAGGVGPDAAEIDAMAVAGPEMAIENGLRFLTDHIAGDLYFALGRPAQNLDRCRTQLRLTELLLETLPEADACVREAARHSPRPGPVVTEPTPGSP